jgi:hypothetical protein
VVREGDVCCSKSGAVRVAGRGNELSEPTAHSLIGAGRRSESPFGYAIDTDPTQREHWRVRQVNCARISGERNSRH